MAIRTVVTMGFGNGTFNGTIKDVVTMGYTISEAVARWFRAIGTKIRQKQDRRIG